MRSQAQHIAYAQGFTKILRERQETIDRAIALFEEADRPELKAQAGEMLVSVVGQSEIDFNNQADRLNQLVSTEDQTLLAVANQLFNNRGPGV